MVALAELTEPSWRRLRVARGSFRLAVRLMAGEPAPSERIGALVSFDFAAETILKAFLLAQLPSKTLPRAFRDLVRAVEEELTHLDATAVIPGAAHLVDVHSDRNDAQHRAQSPSNDKLQEARVHVHDALEALCQKVWGLSFDVPDVDLIRTESLRNAVQGAVDCHDAGETAEAVGRLRAAVVSVLNRVADSLVGEVPLGFVVAGSSQSRGARSARASFDEDQFTRLISSLRSAMVIQVVGLSLLEYQAFDARTRDAPRPNYHGEMVGGGSHEWTEDEYASVLAYSIDAVVRCEEVAGDLAAPFGGLTRLRPGISLGN